MIECIRSFLDTSNSFFSKISFYFSSHFWRQHFGLEDALARALVIAHHAPRNEVAALAREFIRANRVRVQTL